MDPRANAMQWRVPCVPGESWRGSSSQGKTQDWEVFRAKQRAPCGRSLGPQGCRGRRSSAWTDREVRGGVGRTQTLWSRCLSVKHTAAQLPAYGHGEFSEISVPRFPHQGNGTVSWSSEISECMHAAQLPLNLGLLLILFFF